MTRRGARIETLKDIIRMVAPASVLQKTTLPLRRAYGHYQQRHKQDFVFIHINKCGGTSVERALGIHFVNHDTTAERFAVLGADRWQNRYKMTVVRNPYDRVGSMYLYRHRANALDIAAARQGLAEYLDMIADIHAQGAAARAQKTTAPRKFLWTQADWMRLADGRIGLDAAYHLETLDARWADLRKHIPAAAPLEHLKKVTKPYSARDIYTPRTIARVAEIFAEDFTVFGYDFAFDHPKAPTVDSPVTFQTS